MVQDIIVGGRKYMLLNNFEHKKSEQDILGNIYPVGSIFISVNSTNPSELFGGEWEPYAQGRAIFGEGSRVDENNQPYGKIFLQNFV